MKKDLLIGLRKRLIEYRSFAQNKEQSIHINAMEIALGLAEYATTKNRKIKSEELIWFDAGWELIQVFENSEWEDLLHSYLKLKEFIFEHELIQENCL